jgi:hypothetical protein
MRSLLSAATAAIAFVGAACGEVKSSSDAGAVDATVPDDVDAKATSDALTRGRVEVTVFDEVDGVPLAGATVVFLEPDGSLAGRILTDDLGRAAAEMTSGGSVTAVRLDTSTLLVTIMGVEAGDHLVFGAAPPPDATQTAILQVGFARTAHPNHVVRTTCGTSPSAGAASFLEVPMAMHCDRTPRDIVMEASGAEGTEPQYAIVKDVVGSAITVPANAWRPGTSGLATVTSVPPEVKQANVGRLVRNGGRRVFTSFSSVVPTEGSDELRAVIPNALDVGDDMIVTTELFAGTVPGTPKQTIRERRDLGGNFRVDVAADLLPWVSAPRLDLATATLTWSQDGGGEIDALVAEMAYARTVDNTQRYHRWRVIAPTSTGTLALPDLPAALDDIEPRPGDSISGHPAIFLVRTDDETYRELRAHLDRDDTFLSADGADIDLRTKLIVSKFVCGRGCSLPLPTATR